MDEKTFLQLATETKECLTKGHLRDALYLLNTLTGALNNSALHEAQSTTTEDYNRLLTFMQTGSKDESRTEQHLRIMHKAIAILQDARRQYRLQQTGDIYGLTTKKSESRWTDSLANTLNELTAKTDYDSIDDMFDLIWTAPQLKDEEEKAIVNLLEFSTSEVRQYLLSALTLALLEYFDPGKLRLLIPYCSHSNGEVRARATVGLCIGTQLHSVYLQFYPELTEAIGKLDFNKEITYVQHDFCLYLESERIQQKMQQEIIPNLIRAQRQREKLGFDDDELDLSDPASGIDRKTRQRLTDSMREMATLFRDGMDLNLNTFTALKGFPFFRRPCHWLAPFKSERPESMKTDIIQKMSMCDSDKYSISMLFSSMPPKQAEQLVAQLTEQIGEDVIAKKEIRPEHIYHNIIQCLYRLLKRSPWSTEWPVVFSPQMAFIHNTILKESLQTDGEYLAETGRTLLRYKHYTEAKEHLLLLLKQEGGTVDTYIQLAQCEEGEGNLQTAINYYRQADMLQPDDEETLQHLQSCLGRLGQFEAQLDSLTQLEKLRPDDVKILTETGLCLMQLERWKEAQQRFFKMEFNNQRVVPSVRAIAWCALQMKDLELAHRYYHRILDEEPLSSRWEDYLNLGHTEWLKGHLIEALDLYHQYVSKYVISQPEVKDALAPFDQDAKTLLKLGITPSDIQLMHDLIASTL